MAILDRRALSRDDIDGCHGVHCAQCVAERCLFLGGQFATGTLFCSGEWHRELRVMKNTMSHKNGPKLFWHVGNKSDKIIKGKTRPTRKRVVHLFGMVP